MQIVTANTFDEWRPADQRYYVSDTGSLTEATGWRPRTDVREGIAALLAWLRDGKTVRGRRAAPVLDLAAAEPRAASGARG